MAELDMYQISTFEAICKYSHIKCFAQTENIGMTYSEIKSLKTVNSLFFLIYHEWDAI